MRIYSVFSRKNPGTHLYSFKRIYIYSKKLQILFLEFLLEIIECKFLLNVYISKRKHMQFETCDLWNTSDCISSVTTINVFWYVVSTYERGSTKQDTHIYI